jgi:hypothetical protein
LLLIWGVLTLTFFLVHAGPGNPMDRYLSPRISPTTLTQIRQQFDFDQPLPVQNALVIFWEFHANKTFQCRIPSGTKYFNSSWPGVIRLHDRVFPQGQRVVLFDAENHVFKLAVVARMLPVFG